MERTMNFLTYKGSIPDAINQSRREKKLFVVYLSCEDETSSSLEQSTLIDEHVAEVLGRCIFLHLRQGNVDALQFSAIYPQKSIPSISVIGLNGVMLWHHEGYISSEDLKERIEKAWAALHLQETAATLLTASLASRMAEPVNTVSTTLPTQGGSFTSENPSNSSQLTGTSGASGSANSTDLVAQPPSSTGHDELLKITEKEGSKSDSGPCNRTVEEKSDSASTQVKSTLPDCSRSSTDSYTNPNQTGSTLSPKKKE